MFKKFKEIAILPKSSHIETDESETDDREYTKLSFFKGVREMRQQLFMHFRKNMDIEDPPLLSQKNSKTYRILGVKSLEKGGFKLVRNFAVFDNLLFILIFVFCINVIVNHVSILF